MIKFSSICVYKFDPEPNKCVQQYSATERSFQRELKVTSAKGRQLLSEVCNTKRTVPKFHRTEEKKQNKSYSLLLTSDLNVKVQKMVVFFKVLNLYLRLQF